MRISVFLFVIAAVTAATSGHQRIVGGSVTTIDRYPEIVALLAKWSPTWFMQDCGGIILNNRSVVTAAHCIHRNTPEEWRGRVGSTQANSGGVVYIFSHFIIHPNFYRPTFESDIAILRTTTAIQYNNVVQPGRFAGPQYYPADNDVVWAAGWGRTNYVGSNSPQLRHVQVYVINQNICRQRYAERGNAVNDNMLCSGVLDVGGRDQCSGDSGGPLYHNGVVVGITSWGFRCGEARFPGVSARVSRFSNWIQNNA